MSILIDDKTRVLVQGITGREGSYWTKHMINLGTNVVCGVTPGKEGLQVESIPVYNSIKKAIKKHKNIDASMIFVPAKFARDAVYEAIDSGIKLVVVLAEGIPLHDTLKIRNYAKKNNAIVIGGNTSGIITPGKAMMGAFPYWIERVYKPGNVGVLTRSGSLTNEVTSMVIKAGYGVSTLVGVGGDQVPGTRFSELLEFYEKDQDTKFVLIIGELGGSMEEEVAVKIQNGNFTKPLIAYISGITAPEEKTMGHAGAIVTGGQGTVKQKIFLLKEAGAYIAEKPSDVQYILNNINIQK